MLAKDAELKEQEYDSSVIAVVEEKIGGCKVDNGGGEVVSEKGKVDGDVENIGDDRMCKFKNGSVINGGNEREINNEINIGNIKNIVNDKKTKIKIIERKNGVDEFEKVKIKEKVKNEANIERDSTSVLETDSTDEGSLETYECDYEDEDEVLQNNNNDKVLKEINKREEGMEEGEMMAELVAEAERRALIELLDDTSYNNDLRLMHHHTCATLPTKCGGDSHAEGMKGVEGGEMKAKVPEEVGKEMVEEGVGKCFSGKSEVPCTVLKTGKTVSKPKSLNRLKVPSKKKEKVLNEEKIGDQKMYVKEKDFEVDAEEGSERIEDEIQNSNDKIANSDDDDDSQVLYASTSSSSSSSSFNEDDNNDQENLKEYGKGGYSSVHIGSFYNEQYKIVRKVGWGYFSTVWLSWDTVSEKYVALKIVKSGWEFAAAAKDEIKLLESVSTSDSSDKGRNRVIQMFDNFRVKGFHGKHYCLVMEVMGPNLLRLLVQSKQRGLPLVNVKVIMYQIFEGLKYLHEKCKIIHTDLKPENILVVPQHKFVSFAAAQLIETIKNPCNISANMISSQQYGGIKKTRERLGKCNSAASTNANEITNDCSREDITGMSISQKLEHIVSLLKSNESFNENDLLYKGKDPNMEDCAIPIKIADLGNSCWTNHQFTSDIQTLQYRCIETILRAPYGTSSDMWSAACIAFELATGDFLFEPRATQSYSRSQQHLACFVELLGDIPLPFAKKGKLYKKYFKKEGILRCQPKKKDSLQELLVRKYKWSRKQAANFASFLAPMLRFNPAHRSSADEMLRHPWLCGLRVQYASDNTIDSYVFENPQEED